MIYIKIDYSFNYYFSYLAINKRCHNSSRSK